MKIEVEVPELKQTGRDLQQTVYDLENMQSSLQRMMSRLTLESRGRAEVDNTFRMINQRLNEIRQELEALSRQATKKGEQFAEADGKGKPIDLRQVWSFVKTGMMGLDFIPIIGNVNQIMTMAIGRDLKTGENLTLGESASTVIGLRAGKGAQGSVKLMEFADEEFTGVCVWDREMEDTRKSNAFMEFINGAGDAALTDTSMGLLVNEPQTDHPIVRKYGEVAGHIATTVVGAVETVLAVVGFGSSAVLSATGVGSLVGVPAAVLTAAAVSYGANVTMQGARNAGNSVSELYSMIRDGGTGEVFGKVNPTNIPNMSKKEILDGLPKGWTHTENNGFVHVKDANGTIRMRIDPPDKLTKYDHVHLFDENKNPLDINGNVVSPKSPDAHIPYNK
ncbi:uncharacterized protein YukE [Paenibacillus anaericanus]|uniref:pre-toxin TG domain-containing protein n=1 Tax=Paenibacillus anaericanus TaxID=170367 RepID=UPI0027867CD3|nr:pre-toxin TG domain-containing protein [Paenibacillus anaericanus]MDQ0087484.1 uncharacterized protein YukE [Paenibacillus anaericanus]